MGTTLTSKGQVTIPKHIRDSLSLEPGCKIVFDVNNDGELVLRKEGPAEEQTRLQHRRIHGVATRILQ